MRHERYIHSRETRARERYQIERVNLPMLDRSRAVTFAMPAPRAMLLQATADDQSLLDKKQAFLFVRATEIGFYVLAAAAVYALLFATMPASASAAGMLKFVLMLVVAASLIGARGMRGLGKCRAEND